MWSDFIFQGGKIQNIGLRNWDLTRRKAFRFLKIRHFLRVSNFLFIHFNFTFKITEESLWSSVLKMERVFFLERRRRENGGTTTDKTNQEKEEEGINQQEEGNNDKHEENVDQDDVSTEEEEEEEDSSQDDDDDDASGTGDGITRLEGKMKVPLNQETALL